MTITVRLPEDLETELQARLQRSGQRISEFVREAIAEKLEREPAVRTSPYDAGQHLFGRFGSGRTDLSEKADAIVREKIRAKHRR